VTYSQSDKQIYKKDTKSAGSGCLITVLDPADAASEAYRALRTSLLYARVDNPPKVILVTSPGSTEGKSTVCANLGVVLAQAGKRVLIMDCDLRRPVIHRIFGLPNTWGIVNVLVGESNLRDTYQEPVPGMKVLTVGAVPPNPAELLSSQRLSACRSCCSPSGRTSIMCCWTLHPPSWSRTRLSSRLKAMVSC
jgi:Mrp family chromosome partitioning ATPase